MMAAEKCAHCRRGPSGIAGHERLFSHTMGGNQMQFKCRECAGIWVRRQGADGKFTWSLPAAGEHPGADVPGRLGSAPP